MYSNLFGLLADFSICFFSTFFIYFYCSNYLVFTAGLIGYLHCRETKQGNMLNIMQNKKHVTCNRSMLDSIFHVKLG